LPLPEYSGPGYPLQQATLMPFRFPLLSLAEE
jgi:hypothetical protein